MDNSTRKTLAVILSLLEEAQERLSDESMSQVRDAADAEQEKFDNMTPGLQAGERGQKIEAAASALSSAADEIEQASTALDEAIGHLNEATE